MDRHNNKQSWALSVGSRKYIFLLPTFILSLLHLSIGVKRVKRELKGKLKGKLKRELKRTIVMLVFVGCPTFVLRAAHNFPFNFIFNSLFNFSFFPL